MDKTINLIGTVGWEIDSEEFASEMDTATGDISFEMGSGGGYITDGVFMLNLIRAYQGGTTTARISYAASMMTQFAMACDKVEVYDNAIFMIHNAQNIVVGDHNDMREAADLQERMSDMLANAYVKKTGKTLKEIKALMDADTYLFGQEIVDEGFADSVIITDNTKDKDQMVNIAKTKFKNANIAMKNEKLTLEDVKTNFKNCTGGCNMGGNLAETIPSDNVKLVNSKAGENMSKVMTAEDILAMELNDSNFNALKVQLITRNNTVEAQAQANLELTTAMDTTNAKLKEANAKLSEAVSKEDVALQLSVKEQDLKDTFNARVEEAFSFNVANKETILQMVSESDDTKAHQIALDAKPQVDALHTGEPNRNSGTESSIMAYAQRNKGSIR